MTTLPSPAWDNGRPSALRGRRYEGDSALEDMGAGFKMSSCVALLILSWLRLGRACLLQCPHQLSEARADWILDHDGTDYKLTNVHSMRF